FYTVILEANLNNLLFISLTLGEMLLLASVIIFSFLVYQQIITKYQFELKKICEEQQGKLTFAAIEHEECVRKKISAKLHDVGTVLSTVKLYLSMIQPTHLTDKTKVETLKDCKDLLDDTVQTARNLSTSLQPSGIKDFGLLSTLQNFCDKLNHSTGLQISISAEGNINRFQTEHELAVFRILQELTDNISQHANAQYILFSLLHNNNNTLQIFIEHNGNGLSQVEFEQKLYGMQGLGLKNIQNRLNILKGNIRFEKNDNLTNTISVQIPVSI
ncbi:MAG TPA: ATP-binding protein, partial [Chitinophagaceae bacterium]|nr:ATP-binding protein [Chitinophagaceae bacterium]